MENKKVYVWNWKSRTSQYWEFFTLSLKLSELEKYTNEKWYVQIIVNKRKEVDQWWNDLTVAINDYKPKDSFDVIPKEKEEKDNINIDEIPF